MMKPSLLYPILAVCLLFSCSEKQECVLPPCNPPNVEELLIIVNLAEIDSAKKSMVIAYSLYKETDQIVDSAIYEYPNTILFGGYGRLPLNSFYADYSEEVLFDYSIVLSDSTVYTLSEITVRDTMAGVECSCPNYELMSLLYNDDLHEINAKHYSITLQ